MVCVKTARSIPAGVLACRAGMADGLHDGTLLLR